MSHDNEQTRLRQRIDRWLLIVCPLLLLLTGSITFFADSPNALRGTSLIAELYQVRERR